MVICTLLIQPSAKAGRSPCFYAPRKLIHVEQAEYPHAKHIHQRTDHVDAQRRAQYQKQHNRRCFGRQHRKSVRHSIFPNQRMRVDKIYAEGQRCYPFNELFKAGRNRKLCKAQHQRGRRQQNRRRGIAGQQHLITGAALRSYPDPVCRPMHAPREYGAYCIDRRPPSGAALFAQTGQP